MLERQELHCHNCGNYVQFDMDMSMNGNHVWIDVKYLNREENK